MVPCKPIARSRNLDCVASGTGAGIKQEQIVANSQLCRKKCVTVRGIFETSSQLSQYLREFGRI
jgi:hypothetical protein